MKTVYLITLGVAIIVTMLHMVRQEEESKRLKSRLEKAEARIERLEWSQ